jgi:hypothetical protein
LDVYRPARDGARLGREGLMASASFRRKRQWPAESVETLQSETAR